MKIIEINFFLGGGGASRFMVDLSNQYAKDSGNKVITVSVVDTNISGNNFISFREDLNPQIQYIALDAKSGLCFKSIWGIFKLIRKERPNVVHLHANILLILLPVLFCRKVRYIHTIHTLVTRQYPGGIIKRVANWLYKTRKVQPITISQECHTSYKECFGRQDDILINNGRDSLKTTVKICDVQKELSSLGVKNGIPLFLHVSRHHPVKNHDRLFSAFERLTNEGMEYSLIVIGDHYEEYLERFRNHKQIHLIGARTNVGDYMSFADFFVMSSDKEGLPLSLLEAMSMGVVPVCTPAGGIKDVVKNRENGFMGDEISDESFYSTVREAICNGNTISKKSIIEEYKSKYSIEICAEKYMVCYKNM